MEESLKNAFEILCRRFGNHGKAAKALGFTRDHYCALRNGRAKIPRRTAEYILLKANELEQTSLEIHCSQTLCETPR